MNMQRFILLALAFVLVSINIQGQSLDWVKQAGGANPDAAESAGADSAGNTYVIGNFNTQAIFGAGETNATTLNSAGAVNSQDIFLAKFDPTGNLVWVRGIGGTDPSSGGNAGEDRGWGVAVDSAGNSYVTGHLWRYTTYVDFHGVALTGLSGGGVFIAKYDTNGNAIWADNLEPGINPSSNGGGDGYAVAVDGNGNSYVTGVIAGPTPGIGLPTTWKINSGGSVAWEKQALGDGAGSQGQGISADSNGNVYVTGRFTGTTTFGTGETNQTALTADNTTGDGFLASYDSAGNLNWAKQIHSDTGAWGDGIATDIDSNTYVTGPINGSTTFGKNEPNETTLTAQQDADLFVAKFNSDGLLLWVKQGSGNGNARGMAVAVGTLSAYLTGSFGTSITFDPNGPNQTTLSGYALDYGSIFVAKYASDGSFEWASQAGGGSGAPGDEGTGIAFDGQNGVYAAGYFTANAPFGSGETNATTLTSDGSSDVFVARYTDASAVNPGLNLNIAQFHVTKHVKVSHAQSVSIKLAVRNVSTVEGNANATVVGQQGGGVVYSMTMPVTDAVGGGTTTFTFPTFTPDAVGDITWTVTIEDPAPDIDQSVAMTKVVQ